MWPTSAKGGQGLEGTSGVIGALTDTEGAIGYADDSAVKADGSLGVVSIKVGNAYDGADRRGRRPGARGLAGGPRPAGHVDGDRHRPDRHREGRLPADAGVVPASACQTYSDSSTADMVKGYLTYVVSQRRPAGGGGRGRLGAARLLAVSRRPRRSCPRSRPAADRPPGGGYDDEPRRRTRTNVEEYRVTATVSPEQTGPEKPSEPPKSTRRGDRIFAAIVRIAAFTILAALLAVFVFLAIEGWPGLTAAPDVVRRRSRPSPATSGRWSSARCSPSAIALLIAARRSPSAWRCSSRTTRRAGSPRSLGYVVDLLAAVP